MSKLGYQACDLVALAVLGLQFSYGPSTANFTPSSIIYYSHVSDKKMYQKKLVPQVCPDFKILIIFVFFFYINYTLLFMSTARASSFTALLFLLSLKVTKGYIFQFESYRGRQKRPE